MKTTIDRRTIDLTRFPDLVVIYLEMRVNALMGLKTVAGFGPKIAKSVKEYPDGLLRHENLMFSLFLPPLGMRQYRRDFDALEAWARSRPHPISFTISSHVVAAVPPQLGWNGILARSLLHARWHAGRPFFRFPPRTAARGKKFSARGRAQRPGKETRPGPVAEREIHS